ncbi:uncharacterized protein TrAtP1_001867 [Trichoderma atroviride]|uniref:Class II hydrophobin Srh1 n=3 Tax=Trichoderma TaxID=5543 RepID=SRH1_TRIHA|nr:hydrophobin [Trichoderma atroviride IMI 206040]ABS59364.1 hydrophobin [Trichoderma atroviride]EHK42978.1 hydrophobin [Trichoderma atroviride IMI 206040]UKZ60592.1 hypothetical protein TrAtP1_001867 [Trichoderma atroviride]CAA72539.1 hydrophobin [Trichoderma lixii]
MQFSIVALFATGALASVSVCPNGLYSNPQCCGANVLGVAALDCHTPRVDVLTGPIFQAVCAAEGGKQPLCCVVPVAGQDLLCEEAQGTF